MYAAIKPSNLSLSLSLRALQRILINDLTFSSFTRYDQLQIDSLRINIRCVRVRVCVYLFFTFQRNIPDTFLFKIDKILLKIYDIILIERTINTRKHQACLIDKLIEVAIFYFFLFFSFVLLTDTIINSLYIYIYNVRTISTIFFFDNTSR